MSKKYCSYHEYIDPCCIECITRFHSEERSTWDAERNKLKAQLETAENSALDVPALCRTFDYCEEMGSYSQMSLDALERHEAWLIASGRKVMEPRKKEGFHECGCDYCKNQEAWRDLGRPQ